jgi:hypothetical protein
MVKVLALPIASALCCFSWHFVVESAESALTAALGWQVISDRRFCSRNRNLKRRESKEETTVLQNRMHPSQQTKSSIFSVRTYLRSRRARVCRRPASACVHSRVIFAWVGCAYCCRVQCASIFLFRSEFRIFFESVMVGSLFHFKTDNAQYSIKPEDYATNGILTLKSFVCKIVR